MYKIYTKLTAAFVFVLIIDLWLTSMYVREVMKKSMKKLLTPKQNAFCTHYVSLGTEVGAGPKAYRLAFGCVNSTDEAVAGRASKLLQRTDIQARVEQLRTRMASKIGFTVDKVLQHWSDLASADPNDLVQLRRCACRYCHSSDGKYVVTYHEYRTEVTRAENENKLPPEKPKFFYNRYGEIDSLCLNCFGHGEERTYFADTTKLQGPAKLLYAGIKQTRDGMQILMRNQDDALANYAKHLGLFREKEDDRPQKPIVVISQATTDPVQAARIYQEIMKSD